MLDKRTGKLLEKLNELCTDATFRVIEEGELLLEGEDGVSIKNMLGVLEGKGYLEMRYADGGEYCLRVLQEGKSYFERSAAEKKAERRHGRKETMSNFLGAFLGAALGGGLVALLVALILR